MRNIRRIIRTDARRITASVVGVVFIMGLCLIPCLYAWFNIFSNWDPYGRDSTSRIRVAVMSLDKGADLLGIELNLGETIIGALESNDQLGWVFTESREEALWRVYSGDCYAALLVPEHFSRDFISFLTLQFEHPELQYYENGKKNAIAPKITGQAKTAVQKQVNATVLTTLVSGASDAGLALEANGIDIQQLLLDLSTRMDELDEKLSQANGALDNLIHVTSSVQSLLLASSTLVSDVSTTIGYTGELAGLLAGAPQAVDTTVRETVNSINLALQGVIGNFNQFYGELSAALTSPENYNAFIISGRDGAVSSLVSMQSRAAELQSLANVVGMSAMANLFGELSGRLGDLSQTLAGLSPVDVTDSEAWLNVQSALMRALEQSAGINETLSRVMLEAASTLGIRIEDAFYQFNGAARSVSELLAALQTQTASASNSLADVAGGVTRLLCMMPRWARRTAYIMIALVIFTLGGEPTAFIYFQF